MRRFVEAMLAAVLLASVGVLLSACGSWMIHETYSPRGGVIGWKTEGNAFAFMHGYCHGQYRVISRWDGYQGDGQYMYTAGDTVQTVTLYAGYGYMAFVCLDGGQTVKHRHMHYQAGSQPGQQAAPASAAPVSSAPASAVQPPSPAQGGQDESMPVKVADLDIKMVKEVMRQHLPEMAECNRKHCERASPIRGNMLMNIKINPDGRVSSVELSDYATGFKGTYLVDCVRNMIWNIRFPAFDGQQSRAFEIPIEW